MAYPTELRPVRELAYGATDQVPNINVVLSVGAENTGTNTIIITGQVYTFDDALARLTGLKVWLSATAGGVPSAVTAGTVSTGVVIHELTANGAWDLVTNSSGAFGVTAIIAGAATRYLCVQLPDGEIVSSAVITWAA